MRIYPYLSIREFVFALFVMFVNGSAAQVLSGYSLTTGNAGSLTPVAGGTSLMTGLHSHVSSGVLELPFDFYFKGVRQSRFSVNSSGMIALGGTAVGANTGGLSIESMPLITPFGCSAQAVGGSGAAPGTVSYKVTGAAPARILAVSFTNMNAWFSAASTYAADASYEARFFEESGKIEFVYGAMSRNAEAAAASYHIGISLGSGNGMNASINSATNTIGYAGGPYANSYPAGQPVASLTSPGDGTRKTYLLTPAAIASPAGLTFAGIGKTGMTLNWTDNASDETGFAVYCSGDGGASYNFYGATAANTATITASGLAPGTNYQWRVYAVKDGLSAALTGAASTIPAGTITSNGSGDWNVAATWVGGAIPVATDNVVIANGHTVMLNAGGLACNNLTVGGGMSGILAYGSGTAAGLTIAGDLMINAGGQLQCRRRQCAYPYAEPGQLGHGIHEQ